MVLLYSSIKLKLKHNPILKYNLYCQEHINELIDTSSGLDIVLLDFLNANPNSSFPFPSDFIASGHINLSAIGENKLSISTTVTSLYILDKMTIYIELQRKVGSTWGKQCVWNSSRNNTFQISLDKSFTNASSGQYRFYEIYTAEGRGITERKSAYSSITTIS